MVVVSFFSFFFFYGFSFRSYVLRWTTGITYHATRVRSSGLDRRAEMKKEKKKKRFVKGGELAKKGI